MSARKLPCILPQLFHISYTFLSWFHLAYSSMPGHPGERQPGHNPQFQRYKPVEFAPYQGGKSNFPTWDVFTVFSSFPETYSLLSIKASRPTGAKGEVRRAILGTVAQWKEGKPTAHVEAAKILVMDFL